MEADMVCLLRSVYPKSCPHFPQLNASSSHKIEHHLLRKKCTVIDTHIIVSTSPLQYISNEHVEDTSAIKTYYFIIYQVFQMSKIAYITALSFAVLVLITHRWPEIRLLRTGGFLSLCQILDHVFKIEI